MMDGLSERAWQICQNYPARVPKKSPSGPAGNNPDSHPPGFTGKATPYSFFILHFSKEDSNDTGDLMSTFPTSGFKRIPEQSRNPRKLMCFGKKNKR